MNSIFILVLSGFCGLMIGLSFMRRSKDREGYYRSMVSLCSHLINNISYKADRIGKVLSQAEVDSGALKRNLKEYEAYIDGKEFVFSQSVLTKSEATCIKQFFVELGRYDGETQICDLKKREHDFIAKYNEIKQKNAKQGFMSVKLGLLIGLLVGILLI